MRQALVLFVVVLSFATGCNNNSSVSNSTASGSNPAATMEALGKAANSGNVDPRELLRRVAKVYSEGRSFQVDLEQQTAMEFTGGKNSQDTVATLSVEKPNRIAVRQKKSSMGSDVVCDGKELIVSISPMKQYFQTPAPKAFDELMTNPLIMIGFQGRGPLLDLFSNDPFRSLMEGVTSTKYVAKEKIGEAGTHHIALSQPQFEWELWIAADSQPRILKAKFDMSKMLTAQAEMNPQFKGATMIVTQQYSNWQFDQKLPEETFVFVPPTDFKKAGNPFGSPSGPASEPTSPLVGHPAPDVELELASGDHFSLKDLKDKKVVILDFWATWCGPCIQEMPILAQVAEEYQEKDVALYCVNQRETAAKVEAFLEKKELKLAVPLDSKGEVGNAYGVQGIPMLVVVDKAGIVQSVHVGYSPAIGDTLRKELDAILSGKSLGEKNGADAETVAPTE